MLGDLGADVISVERPGAGDPARAVPAFHEALNRNKRSVALDLKSPEGREGLERLLESADVFMEGFRPGTMKRLGFGPEEVAERWPKVVYASISGFGQTGVYRDRPAHDLSYQGVTGLLAERVSSGDVSDPGSLAVGDLSAGTFAALGVVTALFRRERSGRGGHVDVAMTDALVSWMTGSLAPVMNGHQAVHLGHVEPAYGIFRCGDGQLLTLSVAYEDWFWQPLCDVLGLPDLRSLGRNDRVANRESIRQRITEVLARKGLDEWSQLLDAAGVPWGPVHDLEGLAADPHFVERGMFVEVTNVDSSKAQAVAQPLVFDGVRPSPARGVPALGEGNAELLG